MDHVNSLDQRHYSHDLRLTLDAAWSFLARGVKDRRSPFHVPSVATIGLDGRPRVRSVVLRGVDREQQLVRFHTDVRGGKVAEIERDPRVALHAYDPREKLQIRLEGIAALHAGDAVAEEAWSGSKSMSRACYATEVEPGETLVDEDDSFSAKGCLDAAAAQANFSVVLIRVQRIETLYLSFSGHRRAVFDLDEVIVSRWLTP